MRRQATCCLRSLHGSPPASGMPDPKLRSIRPIARSTPMRREAPTGAAGASDAVAQSLEDARRESREARRAASRADGADGTAADGQRMTITESPRPSAPSAPASAPTPTPGYNMRQAPAPVDRRAAVGRSHGNFLDNNVLSEAPENTRLIDSVTAQGIVLGEVKYTGPLLFFNNTVFLWNVPQFGYVETPGRVWTHGVEAQSSTTASASSTTDSSPPTQTPMKVVDLEGDDHLGEGQHGVFAGWVPDVFQIFDHVSHLPELLVIGTGQTMWPLPPALRDTLRRYGMQIEVQSTRRAAATFNVLAQEGRRVGVALLPSIPTSALTGKPLFREHIQLDDPLKHSASSTLPLKPRQPRV